MRIFYVFITFFLCGLSSIKGQNDAAQDHEWIVQLSHADELQELEEWAKNNGATVRPIFKDLNSYIVSWSMKSAKKSLKKSLSKKWDLYPNLQAEPRYTPNDPDYPSQWALPHIKMPEVWDITKGRGRTPDGHDIVVALFDDGFDINHPDYIQNIWKNDAEIPDNGIDDDGNGYVDDYIGWNPKTLSDEHRLTTHGTAVAGIVGAVGDNSSQVAGVNWNVKMMLTSASNSQGQISIADIISAYEYVYEQRKRFNRTNGAEGAFVVVSNFSGGVSERFPKDFPIWCQVYDKLGEQGVLSIGAAVNSDVNVEVVGDLPTLCQSDYLLVVTNSNRGNNLTQGSGYGAQSVDMAAPGVEIVTTTIDGGVTQTFRGASASAPFVAGVASLMYEVLCDDVYQRLRVDPSFLPLELKKAIMNSVTSSPSLTGRTVTGGVLNALGAFEQIISNKELGDCCSISVSSINTTTESCTGARDAMLTVQTVTQDIRGKVRYELTKEAETKSSSDSLFSVLSAGEYRLAVVAERDESCRADTIVQIAPSGDSCSFGTFALQRVMPNPTDGNLSFVYQLDESKHFSLTIYDMAGRQMDRVINTDGVGSGVMTYDGRELVQGVYIAVMRANDLYSALRFTVF